MDSPTSVLDSPVVKTIKALKHLLRHDIDGLIEQVDEFSDLAEDLRLASWRLTNEELRFLERIMRLKSELASEAVYIQSVEGVHQLQHEMFSNLSDQTWHLKESMRIHEELLNLAFTEEEAVTKRMKALEDELNALVQKKEEFRVSNKDEIVILLAKRHDFARLQVKTKHLELELKTTEEDLVKTNKCKCALEDMQSMTLDAIPDV
ncbi:hypothetical protein A2U01_0000753 [Trifolium medium]|uniref:Uncharacterized protein n=1 Tax=Trifolium medium TaxID=97028 RepID=A0A392LYF1_9FABA|nr:hypothetical protein [Trifolium medium]